MKQGKMITPYPGMIIRESVVFAPGVYNFFGKEGLIISGEDIEIDGNHSVFIGGKPKKDKTKEAYSSEFSYGYGEMTDEGLGFGGIGIRMEGCRRVRLHNVCAKGFEIGLLMTDCRECSIYENDFSYNYHNPAWGWEEHKDLGGMILENSHNNELWKNRATDVWSALVLRESSHNYVHHNNCSHTSNVGLRMWLACHNRIEDNNFSWGLRKEPDEVHARDSSCVLIEAASCRNVLKRNDMRYGGDGLFIRSLNNMMSTHNLIEENDTSFANNNAIEAWDAYNVYIRNKANYSSYGFWLGCSDHTVLIGNQVIGNGKIFQNAPECFGNAGIAVVNGSGNDFYLEGNQIEENNGPGLAVRNKQDDPSRNWVLVGNKIRNNKNDPRGYKGHGIYLKHVFGMNLIDNEIEDNEGSEIFTDENVSELTREEPGTKWEKADIFCDREPLEAGQTCVLRPGKVYEDGMFYTDRGLMASGPKAEFTFTEPGRVRVRFAGRSGRQLATGEKNFYILPQGTRLDGILEKSAWNCENGEAGQKEENGICLFWHKQTQPRFSCAVPENALNGKTHLTLLCHYENDYIDMDGAVKGPVITFADREGRKKTITPKPGTLAKTFARENEAKYEKMLLEIPLDGSEKYDAVCEEGFSGEAVSMTISFEMPLQATGALTIWDARLCGKKSKSYEEVWSPLEIPESMRERAVQCSSGQMDGRIFGDVPYCYTASPRWESTGEGNTEEWGLSFGMERPVDALELGLYMDGRTTAFPEEIRLYDKDGSLLTEIRGPRQSLILMNSLNLRTEGLRVVFRKAPGKQMGIWKCRILKELCTPASNRPLQGALHLRKAVIKLNVEQDGKGLKPGGLEAALYESNEEDILASPLLCRKSLDAEAVSAGKEVSLDFDGLALECGRTYHLMLWQREPAEGVQKGAYYRWVGEGISAMDGSYGYISGINVTDRQKTGWGKNYLKLIYDEVLWDGSNKSDGMGNRFGLRGMEKLYQKFRVPTEKHFGEYV